jgi:hypothetical protein
MDIEEPIRFQILSEVFTDTTPTPTNIGPTGRRQSAADATAANDLAANSTKIPPYALTVSRVTFLAPARIECMTNYTYVFHYRVLLRQMVLDR